MEVWQNCNLEISWSGLFCLRFLGFAGRGVGGGLRGFAGELGKEGIAAFAGDEDVLRAERAADALLGEGSGMDGVVQEPGAVIVPEVMVLVLSADADAGQGGEGIHDA